MEVLVLYNMSSSLCSTSSFITQLPAQGTGSNPTKELNSHLCRSKCTSWYNYNVHWCVVHAINEVQIWWRDICSYSSFFEWILKLEESLKFWHINYNLQHFFHDNARFQTAKVIQFERPQFDRPRVRKLLLY